MKYVQHFILCIISCHSMWVDIITENGYEAIYVQTKSPTNNPTEYLTQSPTSVPTKHPTPSPTNNPSSTPTLIPTKAPTKSPTNQPSNAPTPPTFHPTTSSPTETPTKTPPKPPTPTPTPYPSIYTGRTRLDNQPKKKNDDTAKQDNSLLKKRELQNAQMTKHKSDIIKLCSFACNGTDHDTIADKFVNQYEDEYDLIIITDLSFKNSYNNTKCKFSTVLYNTYHLLKTIHLSMHATLHMRNAQLNKALVEIIRSLNQLSQTIFGNILNETATLAASDSEYAIFLDYIKEIPRNVKQPVPQLKIHILLSFYIFCWNELAKNQFEDANEIITGTKYGNSGQIPKKYRKEFYQFEKDYQLKDSQLKKKPTFSLKQFRYCLEIGNIINDWKANGNHGTIGILLTDDLADCSMIGNFLSNLKYDSKSIIAQKIDITKTRSRKIHFKITTSLHSKKEVTAHNTSLSSRESQVKRQLNVTSSLLPKSAIENDLIKISTTDGKSVATDANLLIYADDEYGISTHGDDEYGDIEYYQTNYLQLELFTRGIFEFLQEIEETLLVTKHGLDEVKLQVVNFLAKSVDPLADFDRKL
eukprot:471994_1